MAIGDLMPDIPGMITTFYDDFSNGLAKWPNTKYPWRRETNINGEHQYYPDQSLLQASDKTIFIDSDGNLCLRCINTPSYLADTAKIVLNGYIIKQIVNNTQLLLQGENYYDRANYQNAVGIGWNRDPSGTCQFPGFAEQNYTSIVDTVDDNGNPAHLITLPAGIPSNVSFNDPNYRLNIFRKQPQISGIVTTQNTQANGYTGFSQKTGRWLFKIKAPRGQFCFPAVWHWRDYDEAVNAEEEAQKGIEGDVWEILGHAPDISYHTLHSPGFSMRPNGVPLLGTYQGVEQWKTASMQQFQKIDPNRDYSSDFFWVGKDVFDDGSTAWYAEETAGSGLMIEIFNALMSPLADDGIIDEAMMILNNAYSSDWSWYQSKLFDASYSRFVGPTAPPWDFKIAEVHVQRFPSEQGGNANTSSKKTYTNETVIGPVGTIDQVVVCLPNHETDRQGTIHEVELKLAYRPVNIPADKIGIKWRIDAAAPLQPVFIDGDEKSWRARIQLTTTDTTPLPKATDFKVVIESVTLLP